MNGIDPNTLLIGTILVQVVIIALSTLIGSTKGRAGEGFIFGFFLSVLGLVITLFLKKAQPYVPQPPPLYPPSR